MSSGAGRMHSIVVDTNPLAYIYKGTPGFGKKYATVLGELAGANVLLIPEIVYGELSLIFRSDRELDAFLRDTGIAVGQIARSTYVTAAKRWDAYNKRRVLMCHRQGGSAMRKPVQGPG